MDILFWEGVSPRSASDETTVRFSTSNFCVLYDHGDMATLAGPRSDQDLSSSGPNAISIHC